MTNSKPVRSPRRVGLFLKLMGAFALILLTMALLTTWLARRATRAEFTLYTTSLGESQAELLVPILADYYRNQGSWQGVEQILGSTVTRGAGRRMGQGMMGPAGSLMGRNMWEMMGLRTLLLDREGLVLADSAGDGAATESIRGERLDPAARAAGAPITVGGEQVGTVLVTTLAQAAGESDGFIQEVNRALLLAVLGAGTLALLLGGLFTWRLTRPLRTLTAAAEAIAGGDLDQEVSVPPGDEIGDLAAAFNQMAARLTRSEALRRQMTADVAHELRTPLAVIQGNVEALQDGVFPLTREALAPIATKTALLNRLVEDLRQLALAEADALPLEQALLDPGTLLREAVAEFKPAAREKEIVLTAALPANLPAIRADRQRLGQVLGNLIGNALRHTPPGATITVHVDRDGDQIPGFDAHRGPPSLIFSVRDSGPGIQPSDLPNLFERFFRADKGRSRDGSGGGSGLGLAIVRALVEAHGGMVGAANAPGGGAVFWFTLPLPA